MADDHEICTTTSEHLEFWNSFEGVKEKTLDQRLIPGSVETELGKFGHQLKPSKRGSITNDKRVSTAEHENNLKKNHGAISGSIEGNSTSDYPALEIEMHHEDERNKLTKENNGVSLYRKEDINHQSEFQKLYTNLFRLEQMSQIDWGNLESWSRQRSINLYKNLASIEHSIDNVGCIFSSSCLSTTEDKDRNLQDSPSSSSSQSSGLDLRVGFWLGCLTVLFLSLTMIVLMGKTSPNVDWSTTIRLHRAPLVLSLFLLQAGISLIIWQRYNINYEKIFELEDSLNLPYQYLIELGCLLGILWCLALIPWLVEIPQRISNFSFPLLVIVLSIAYLLNPTATCHRQERIWLLKVLGRILTAPFHSVKFSDYWIADQFVSIVPLFLDLEYLACYYSTSSVQCATRNYPHLLIRSIVAIAPAWLRVCQCIRISRDESWRPHQLFNALKYGSMIYVTILSIVARVGEVGESLDGLKILWLVSATVVSCFAAGWDMIYDFGVFESLYSVPVESNKLPSKKYDKQIKRWPLLRQHLTFPVWLYYLAIIEDWVLKFGWLIFIVLTRMMSVEVELALTVTTITDLLSKFIWDVIKVENEWRLRS